jgi:hypothetical protein
MSTYARTELRVLITAVQAAVRAVEADPQPVTLRDLDAALCALPLDDLDDDADQAVRDAVALVSDARDSSVFVRLHETAKALEELGQGAMPPLHEHPAMKSAVLLLSRCYAEAGNWPDGSAFRRAWSRAAAEGLPVLRAVVEFPDASPSDDTVKRRVAEWSAAVRRAVAYRALYKAREALVKAARGYGLFPIGGRQPLPDGFHGAWTREIGQETYRFEVTPPDLSGGAPFGWVLVTRTSDMELIRALALTGRDWQGGSDSRMTRALYAI